MRYSSFIRKLTLILTFSIVLSMFACTGSQNEDLTDGRTDSTAGETERTDSSTSAEQTEDTEDTSYASESVTESNSESLSQTTAATTTESETKNESESVTETNTQTETETETETEKCEHDSCVGERKDGEYVYVCSNCGKNIDSVSVSSDVEIFISALDIANKYPTVTPDNGGVRLVTDDGECYVRVKGGGASSKKYNCLYVYDGGNEVSGKYMVMKYRINKNHLKQRYFYFCASTLNDSYENSRELGEFVVSEDGKWHIAVIDLTKLIGGYNGSYFRKDENGRYVAKYIMLQPNTTLSGKGNTGCSTDIAYIALCDKLSDVGSIIGTKKCEYYTQTTSYDMLSASELASIDLDSEQTTEPDTNAGTEQVSEEETTMDIIYDKFDLDSYMEPIWSGDIVRNETVMFVGADDKIPLLYHADNIISVRSYDLSKEYVKGVDYDYVDGYLVLLENTSIPYISYDTYYSCRNPEQDWLYTRRDDGEAVSTYWGEGTVMTQWQLAVTYKHSDSWQGYNTPCSSERYQSFINMLENGEDVTVLFYGDSITNGASASAVCNTEPYSLPWTKMFVEYVAKHYGYSVKYIDAATEIGVTNVPAVGKDVSYGNRGTITYINSAVGGWSTDQGYQNVNEYVVNLVRKYGCDLFVLAFGMNNAGSTADSICDLLEKMVNKVKDVVPEVSTVLVSTMSPNPEANVVKVWYGKQVTFEPEMLKLADKLNASGTICAVAPMTSMSCSVLETKRFRDYTGNNINHPNDFMVRIYAQVLTETVFGYDNLDKVK